MKLSRRVVVVVACIVGFASAIFVGSFLMPKFIWYCGITADGQSQVLPVSIEIWSDLKPEIDPSQAEFVAFGDFKFRLPDVFRQDLADEDQSNWRSFNCGTTMVHVRPPMQNAETRQARFSAPPGSRADQPHSYVRMIQDIYEVSPSSFRWSMTSDEFSYFRSLLEAAENREPFWATKIAVYYTEDVDFVVYFLDKSILVEVYPWNGEFFGSILIEGDSCQSWTSEALAKAICRSFSKDEDMAEKSGR